MFFLPAQARARLIFLMAAAALTVAAWPLLAARPSTAATFTVTRFDDPAPDGCAPGDCSLREAVIDANANPGTADTISLGPGTYTLTRAGTGEDAASTGDLDVTTNINIVGAGAASTIIDGGLNDRIFDMAAGLPISTLSLSDLTLRNGNPGAGNGGGIRVGNSDTLNLSSVIVADNFSGLNGGGISSAGTVNMTDVTVRDNQASGVGGGFHNAGATSRLTATRATISGNVALGSGGAGLYNETSAMATMTNVTISGNLATGGTSSGGGIHNRTGAALTLVNATITGNGAGSFGGGGIKNNGTGTVNMKNTIVAGNSAGSGANCSGTVTSQGHNLDSGTTCSLGGPGDLSGADPLLGPLADNGGATQTHAIPGNSPAVNAGDNAGCPASDQRGVSRPQFTVCDIGAYEYDGTPPPPTQTPSPTATPTPTPAPTQTPSPIPTPSSTPGPTSTLAPSPTPSPVPTTTLAPTPTPTPTFTPTPAPSTPPTPTPTAFATPSSTPAATPPPTPSPPGGRHGDADCDGDVDAIDALMVLREVAGLPRAAGCIAWGDADCDGDIDAVDALRILRHVAGLPVAPVTGCPQIGASVLVSEP